MKTSEKQLQICMYLIGAIGCIGDSPDLTRKDFESDINDILKKHKNEFHLSSLEVDELKELTIKLYDFVKKLGIVVN